jgi:tetratricopeptide (TPR) repeat protein
MKCPVCRAMYRPPPARKQAELAEGQNSPPSTLCRRCGVDLRSLIQIHDQSIWYHRRAIQAFNATDYAAATHLNHQALALHANNADFHALAGQLWALQGDFQKAISAWRKAKQLDPQHAIAGACLEKCIFAGDDEDCHSQSKS